MARILKTLQQKDSGAKYTTVSIYLEKDIYKKLAATYYKQQAQALEENKPNTPFGRWLGELLLKALG